MYQKHSRVKLVELQGLIDEPFNDFYRLGYINQIIRAIRHAME